jgi:hypothetical protein
VAGPAAGLPGDGRGLHHTLLKAAVSLAEETASLIRPGRGDNGVVAAGRDQLRWVVQTIKEADTSSQAMTLNKEQVQEGSAGVYYVSHTLCQPPLVPADAAAATGWWDRGHDTRHVGGGQAGL